MFDLPLHQLTFHLEATTTVHMGAQAGAQLRGALWQSLSEIACTNPAERQHPAHAWHCPACFLLELETHSPRGRNPPRPFAVRPPLGVRAEQDRVYKMGETFAVGMTLMGKAAPLFPYLVQGLRLAGQQGLGYGRGRFAIVGIENRAFSEHEVLLEGRQVSIPGLSINRQRIQAAAEELSRDRVRLRFLSPTTLKDHGQILEQPAFRPLMARLLERIQALVLHYGEGSADQADWEPLYASLVQAAAGIRTVQDNTRWVELRSGSRRSGRMVTISGFVGEVLFEGDLSPFREWLLWGQAVQVGKNVVKGNGWYEIANG